MNFKHLHAVIPHSTAGSVALLLIRVVAGLAFMFHGWGKIQDPFGWMGDNAFAPEIFLALAAISEFAGGLAWILGLLTPLASFGMACTMVVAVYMHAVMNGDPFVSKGGASYELAAVYLFLSLLFLALGPGRFSLDRQFFGEKS